MLAVEQSNRRTGLGAALVTVLLNAMAKTCHEVRTSKLVRSRQSLLAAIFTERARAGATAALCDRDGASELNSSSLYWHHFPVPEHHLTLASRHGLLNSPADVLRLCVTGRAGDRSDERGGPASVRKAWICARQAIAKVLSERK